MMRIIEQTHKEKLAMYMKCSKKELSQMLIECNRLLTAQMQVKIMDGNSVSVNAVSTSVTTKKEGYYSDNFNAFYVDSEGKKHLR